MLVNGPTAAILNSAFAVLGSSSISDTPPRKYRVIPFTEMLFFLDSKEWATS